MYCFNSFFPVSLSEHVFFIYIRFVNSKFVIGILDNFRISMHLFTQQKESM